MSEFSHQQPSHKPTTTPANAETEPVFSDFEPPYPADGSHPGWKPVTRPASLTPTHEFSHPDRGDAPVSPPPKLTPTPEFSGREAGDAPRPTPTARLEREPVFSHGDWRRGGQPAARQPAGSPQRHGRPGSGWPSVAVYPSRPGAARRPAGTGPATKPGAGPRTATPPVADLGAAARPVPPARPRPRPSTGSDNV
jgi:hypothetical protein